MCVMLSAVEPPPPFTHHSLSCFCCRAPCAHHHRYYCDGNSTVPTQHPCGNASVYCPRGSGSPRVALPGEFTQGPSNATMSSTSPCPSGSYCLGGSRILCPGGRFGCADRLGSEECNGLCTPGFYCPTGATSSQAVPCGGSDTNPLATTLYCPVGSVSPRQVDVGYYSLAQTAAVHQRSGQALCPEGSFCVLGVLVRIAVLAV